MMNLSRRKMLATTAGMSLVGVFGTRAPIAHATAEQLQEAVTEFAAGATPVEGTVSLTAPEIAENGNTVPISVSVESAMTEDSYVESIIILAESNPNPGVATFHFTPASGVAQASTRMRLAKTQNVVALAKMNDGSVFSDTKNIKVTIGGCGG